MKKHLFAAVAMASALFTACDKDNDPILPHPADTEGARVSVTLTESEDAHTRAFFDTTATAEAWEKSLSSLSVFAFDNAGSLIVRRDFTSAELAARSAVFSLPKSAAGATCTFCAVANLDGS